MFERRLTIFPHQNKSFFLFDPRGTGKTSWVKTHFPDALYIDLLSHRQMLFLQGDPKR